MGNERFRRGKTQATRRTPADFSALASGQAPKAIVIGCADSRVPPEILFDQGLGDRAIAANVKASAELTKQIEPDFSRLLQKDQLKIVGAVYDLASGRVSLLS
jgi:carbonic anhydrase